jgi:hypothetical protein
VADRTLWVCCSAERLPLASGTCGSALAIAVLEHVPDDRAALRELARVLEPGGLAWVTVPHALHHISPVFRRANRRHDRRLGHLRRYEADTLVAAGGEAGLESVEVQFTGHAIKVVQFVAGRLSDRLWWWCERHDRRRASSQQGSMQLSVVFACVSRVVVEPSGVEFKLRRDGILEPDELLPPVTSTGEQRNRPDDQGVENEAEDDRALTSAGSPPDSPPRSRRTRRLT